MTRRLIVPPHLILPRKSGLHVHREILLPAVRIEGWVTVELIDAATGLIKRRLRSRNLITDAGLNLLANNVPFSGGSSGYLDEGGSGFYMAVGTGSTAPAVTDASLDAELADPGTNRSRSRGGIGDTSGYEAGPPDYWWHKRTYSFTTAQANGNLTECGLFTASTGGTLFMRHLLKDSGGTPTTVVKTSSEELRIVYELRVYPPTADATTDDYDLSGETTDIILRPRNVATGSNWAVANWPSYDTAAGGASATNGSLGARTASPSGSATQASSRSWSSYITDDFFRDETIIWQAAAGASAFTCLYNTRWQLGFTPAIAKDNTKRLTVVIRHSWARTP